MISLSYENGLVNPGIPLRLQIVQHRWHRLSVEADPASPTFDLSLLLMSSFAEQAEKYRRFIDMDYYNPGSHGHRYRQGNSHIAIETRLGLVPRFCLVYAPVEDVSAEKGPSNFSLSRLSEMTHALVARAPQLVACSQRVEKLMNNVALPEPSTPPRHLRSAARIIALRA